MNARYWFVAFSIIFLSLTVKGQSDVYSYLPDNFDALEYDAQFPILDSLRHNGERPNRINLGIALLGITLGESAGDPIGIAQWATMASRLYGNTGLYSEAYKYGLIGLENSQKAKSLKLEVQALTRLGRTQMDLGDFDEAVRYAEQAIDKAQELPDSVAENRGWAYNMVGEIKRTSGDFDASIAYYESALKEFEEIGFEPGREAVTHNMGLAEVGRGNYEKGRELLDAELHTYIAYDPVRKMEYNLAMSDLLDKTASVEEALAMAKEGKDFANSIDNQRWMVKFLNQMALLEKNRQNWDVAWDLREEATAISEEVLGEKVRRQSEILDVRFDLKNLETENTILLEQNRNQVLYSRGMVAIIVLILLIVSILIFNFVKTRRYTKALSARNKQLDGLIQEKDTLMNIMAHDLKAPLHAIGGMIELIGDPETPEAVRNVCLEKINVALYRGTTLISNLLEMAALESGKVGVSLSEVRIQEVMEDAIEDNAAQAHQKGISLNLEPAGDIQVQTDPVLVGRILNNFLSNAIKYSPKGKSVTMRVQEQEDGVVIQVADQGPGLSADDKTKLFQKFKTLSAKPTAGENSTGLGLALSWALSQKIKAEIQVESELKAGAIFALKIPKVS